MAEQLDLTAPVVPPSITNYKVRYLELNWDAATIVVGLKGTNGESFRHAYSGTTATTLMNSLNTLNMSTTSLQKRILNRLVTDGVLAGTVSGSPDA